MTDDELIDGIIVREGGDKFTNDPRDRGGATKYGITAAVLGEARGLGRAATADEVQALAGAEAREIYRERYIEAPGFKRVLNDRLRALLVDSAVQHGPGKAVMFLQGVLGITQDGLFGDDTYNALQDADPEHTYREVWATRARYYASILRAKPDQRRFAGGWFLRLCDFA